MRKCKVDIEGEVIFLPKDEVFALARSNSKAKILDDEIPNAATIRAIEQANRGEGKGISYEGFLDKIERRSPSLKAKVAKWRKAYERKR